MDFSKGSGRGLDKLHSWQREGGMSAGQFRPVSLPMARLAGVVGTLAYQTADEWTGLGQHPRKVLLLRSNRLPRKSKSFC